MHLSDAHHFRKLVAGACMGLAPLVLLVATVVHPDVKTDEVALLTSINESAAIVIPFFILSLAFAVGMICLAVGLYRARAVQSWMAICLGVGAVLLAISGPAAATWLGIVAAAFLVVGFGSIGRMVYRESDEAWEHTPEYEGFRPVPGMR